MTEEEAKTKWCPFARVRNSAIDDSDLENCATSHHDDDDHPNYHTRIVGPAPGPAYNRFWVSDDKSVHLSAEINCIGSACMAWRRFGSGNDPNQGYCGLAGGMS